MAARTWLALAAMAVLAACGGKTASGGDTNTGDNNNNTTGGGGANAFTARIIEPNGSVSVFTNTAFRLRARFEKAGNEVSPATVTWSTDTATLGSTNPLENVFFADGVHTVRVNATLGTETASDEVVITVGTIAVEITSPGQDSKHQVGDTLRFNAQAFVRSGVTDIGLVTGTPGANQRTATFAWSSSLEGPLATTEQFDQIFNTPGERTITLTVTDQPAPAGTGASGTASIHISVQPLNTAPQVSITVPATCPMDLASDATQPMAGIVADAEEPALTTGRWLDTLTGVTAEGNSFTFGSTVLGKHVIVFSATDAQGATGEASCAIFVFPAGGSRASLFPSAGTINGALPNGNRNIDFVGSDGTYTFVGNNDGLGVYDAAQAAVGTYDATDLFGGGGNTQVRDLDIVGGTAVIATADGLAKCSYAAGAFTTPCTRLDSSSFRAGAVSADLATGGFVAGASNDGLYLAQYDSAGAQTREMTINSPNIPSNNVHDVLFAGSTLYVATAGGLCIVSDVAAAMDNPSTLCPTPLTEDNSVLPNDDIRSLALAGGTLWIGTAGGLARYDVATAAMIVYRHHGADSLIDNHVNDVVVDAAGIVWVATNGGVSRFDPASGLFTSFTANDWGGQDNQVNSIYIDAAGTKWFGTDSGVYLYSGA